MRKRSLTTLLRPAAIPKARDPLDNMDFRVVWRVWHFRALRLWLERHETMKKPMGCMGCGTMMKLEVTPPHRSSAKRLARWRPEKGQIVCDACDDQRRDFRPPGFKRFQAQLAGREWEQNTDGRWTLRNIWDAFPGSHGLRRRHRRAA